MISPAVMATKVPARPRGQIHPAGVLFANIAAENCHGADTKAQREKSLVHGAHQRTDCADFLHPCKVRQQMKESPSLAPGRKKLLIARITIMANSASIMILVIRSRPLCRPRMRTRMPITTTTTIRTSLRWGWPARLQRPLPQRRRQSFKTAGGGQIKIVQHPAGNCGENIIKR